MATLPQKKNLVLVTVAGIEPNYEEVTITVGYKSETFDLYGDKRP